MIRTSIQPIVLIIWCYQLSLWININWSLFRVSKTDSLSGSTFPTSVTFVVLLSQHLQGKGEK